MTFKDTLLLIATIVVVCVVIYYATTYVLSFFNQPKCYLVSHKADGRMGHTTLEVSGYLNTDKLINAVRDGYKTNKVVIILAVSDIDCRNLRSEV